MLLQIRLVAGDKIFLFHLVAGMHQPLGEVAVVGENDQALRIRIEASDVMQMPVPSSYNDIGVSAAVRDFVGWAWYERTFFVPNRWKSDKLEIMLRFGAVHYTAVGEI